MPTDAPLPLPARSGAPSRVTAVLVAHDGAGWLPQTLAALRAQTRPVDAVVAVDTGSTDLSRALLVDAFGAEHVVDGDPGAGFGAAVARGLAHLAGTTPVTGHADHAEWVWLLHDDVEAEPEALESLLAEAVADPSVGIVGPKILGWYDARLLLEVGVTIARSGRRETLLERREQDQGQHDGTRQVLAVSTAGMLVRQDVWDELGGLDPELPLLRDDVDLGWRASLAGHRVLCVTDAVVHHAEAAAHGRRPVAVAGGRVQRLDRQHAIRVLLLNLPWFELPLATVRLVLGSAVRAASMLIGKLPGAALDETVGLLSVLSRPDRLLTGRRARARTRRTSPRAAHPLLAPRGSGWRHFMETVHLLVGPGPAAAAGGAHRAVETGPTPDEVDDLPAWGTGLARRVATRPGVLLGALLVLLSLLACRALLGGGRLMGGALLPAPDSAGDLWRTYTEAWHPVGVGSTTDSPPYLAVLAALGTLLAGKATWAVDLLVLGAVPLAGVSGYLAIRRVVQSGPLRVWAAATYAVLPPVVGAVAAGRLSTIAVAVLLPVTALAVARTLDAPDRPGSVRAAWAAGLLLAVLTAFAPLVYLLALVLLAAVAALLARGRALARVAVVAVVPPLLLLPWLPAVVREPSLLLLEAGFPGPGLSDQHLPPLAVFLLHPGGPGMYPMALTAGLLLAALAGLLRHDRRRLVLAGWAAGLVGLLAALVQSRVSVTAPTLQTAVPAWSGPALVLAGAGLVLAATVGASGARARMAHSSFGWRQPTAVALAVVAGLVPVACAGWWVVAGADGPIGRQDPVLLPAFVAAEGTQPDQPRTLVIRSRAADRLAYAVLRAEGPRLGDAETTALADVRTGLDRAVADLASGRGGDAAAGLLPYGVRFVLMSSPLDPDLARDIDAVPGLVRVSGPQGSLVWRVQYPVGRLRLLDRGAAPASATVLPSGSVGSRIELAGAPGPRLLAVADRHSTGWRATVAGHRLTATTYDGWAQAFRVPAGGGLLRLRYDPGARPALLWGQAGAVLLVLVLVLPAARRHDLADAPTEDEVAEPVGAGARRRT